MRYDFDEYESTESPCKRCAKWAANFPDCIEGCRRLATFQAALVGAVSTGKTGAAKLPYFLAVSREKRD